MFFRGGEKADTRVMRHHRVFLVFLWLMPSHDKTRPPANLSHTERQRCQMWSAISGDSVQTSRASTKLLLVRVSVFFGERTGGRGAMGHTVTHPVHWKGTEGGERKTESHSSSHTTSFPSLITASATHTTKSMLTHSRVIEYERSSLYISVSEELNGQNRR